MFNCDRGWRNENENRAEVYSKNGGVGDSQREQDWSSVIVGDGGGGSGGIDDGGDGVGVGGGGGGVDVEKERDEAQKTQQRPDLPDTWRRVTAPL